MAARKSTRVNRKYKTKYRVTNWRDYERGLRSRGDITVWFSDEARGSVDTTELLGEVGIADINIVIPPRRGAVPSDGAEGTWAQRNATLETIRRIGRQGWQRGPGYRRQGSVENLFFRYKRTLGNSLRARG